MEKEKEEWIDGILNSTNKISRAKPSAQLYSKIEGRLFEPEVKLISIQQWRWAAAAALLLLFLNVFALRQYNGEQTQSLTQGYSVESDEQAIVSDYNFYEGI